MIEIFRTNQFFATLLLIPYTFLIRIHSLIYPKAYVLQDYDTPISKYLFLKVFPSPIFQNIVACFLIFFLANFINRHIIQNRLSKHLTLLPGLFFILITAGMPGGLILSPALISTAFLLLGLLSINRIYKTSNAPDKIFNTGIYFAIASFIYPGNLFFWGFGVIALLILRSFKISELLMFTLGMIAPFFLLGTYYYWNGMFELIWEYFQFSNGIFGLFLNLNLTVILYLSSIGLIAMYIISRYNTFTMKSSIQVQKKVDVVFWFMLFCPLILFFTDGLALSHLVILAIPFAMFIGLSYEKMKNSLVAEVIHICLIVLILVSQFQGLL